MTDEGGGGTSSGRDAAPGAPTGTTAKPLIVSGKKDDPTSLVGPKRRFISDQALRGSLAILFFALLAGTVFLSFFRTGTGGWSDTQKWLQLMLPAETALLGSATGFYFGGRNKDE